MERGEVEFIQVFLTKRSLWEKQFYNIKKFTKNLQIGSKQIKMS
jgi:hypothetical protein